jgi:predicted nucleotidyltransferase
MNAVVPQTLIDAIVRTYAPQRVVLFGSRARGTATEDSDLDLLVVLDDDVPGETLSWRRRHEARGSYSGPVDIIPCRQGVLTERARVAGSFADTLLRDGVVVYERN